LRWEERRELRVARVERVDVADLHHLAGLVPGGPDLLGLGYRKAQRLFAEHMRSARERVQRYLGMVLIGGGHEDRVDSGVQQLLIAAVGRESAALQFPAHVCRRVGDADDLVESLQALQVGNMLDLADQARADDTDPDTLYSFHPLPLTLNRPRVCAPRVG